VHCVQWAKPHCCLAYTRKQPTTSKPTHGLAHTCKHPSSHTTNSPTWTVPPCGPLWPTRASHTQAAKQPIAASCNRQQSSNQHPQAHLDSASLRSPVAHKCFTYASSQTANCSQLQPPAAKQPTPTSPPGQCLLADASGPEVLQIHPQPSSQTTSKQQSSQATDTHKPT
jgi:hypothetical protein